MRHVLQCRQMYSKKMRCRLTWRFWKNLCFGLLFHVPRCFSAQGHNSDTGIHSFWRQKRTLKRSIFPPCLCKCIYVCSIMYVWSSRIARVWTNQVMLPILLVVSWTGKMNIPLSAFAPENLVSRDGFGSPVPRQPTHLQNQAEPGAYLQDSSRVPRRRPFIYLNRHTPSAQSRVCPVTQLRTDGVHCRESTGTGPVNLKIVPNECCIGRSPWTN